MAEPLAPSKPMPQKISALSSAFLLVISLSLISFSFYFLSFRDNIFWFVLSNAIIFLIAAADSDSYSAAATPSSKHKPDLYDEYVRHIRSRIAFSAPVPEPRSEDNKDPDSDSRGENTKETDSPPPPPPEEPVPESTQTEDHEKKAMVAVDVSRSESDEVRSDGGDFLALSVEELNRRAEDFIRRFKRETRLQEMRERKRLKQV